MKILQFAEYENIFEVGDASVPAYPFVRTDRSTTDNPYFVAYEFVTDAGINYEVTFAKVHGVISINFSANNSINDVVNKGEMYAVMSTITKIIIQYLRSFKKNASVKFIKIEPSKNFEGDRRRTNLYLAYIKKQLRYKNINVSTYSNDDIITIEL